MDGKLKIAAGALAGYLLLRWVSAGDDEDKATAEVLASSTLLPADLPPFLAAGATLYVPDPVTAAPIQIIPIQNKMKSNTRTDPVKGIVIHYTLTNSPKQTRAVLESRGFSTNFEVDQDGKIYQYLDPDTRVAWATGGQANRWTVGIDVTRPLKLWNDPTYPPMQMQALRSLVRWLAARYKIPIKVAPDKIRGHWPTWKGKGYTVFRHRNFVATGCPGKLPVEMVAT